MSAFQALGVRIVIEYDLAVLKTPILGSRGFLDSFLSAKQQEMQQIADEIARLPHKHVAFHLTAVFLLRANPILGANSPTRTRIIPFRVPFTTPQAVDREPSRTTPSRPTVAPG